MVSAIIMASGFGSRMGKNKLLLPYKGKVMIEYVMDAVLNSDLKEKVFIGREEGVLKIALERGIKTVVNPNAYRGQSEAIKLGIKNLNTGNGYMFLTGDQPFINSQVINILVREFEKYNNSIIVPLCNDKRSSPVIFPGDLKEELLALEGDKGGREIIKTNLNRVKYVPIDEPHCLMDVDTYEDYKSLIENNCINEEYIDER